MNISVLSLLLSAGLAVYVVYFRIRCYRRLEEIAASVEMSVEKATQAVNNIVRFRRPGAPRSAVVMRDDELDQVYRCQLRGREDQRRG